MAGILTKVMQVFRGMEAPQAISKQAWEMAPTHLGQVPHVELWMEKQNGDGPMIQTVSPLMTPLLGQPSHGTLAAGEVLVEGLPD